MSLMRITNDLAVNPDEIASIKREHRDYMSQWAIFLEDGGVIIECPRCQGNGREERGPYYEPTDSWICSLCDGSCEIEDEAHPVECDDDLVGA